MSEHLQPASGSLLNDPNESNLNYWHPNGQSGLTDNRLGELVVNGILDSMANRENGQRGLSPQGGANLLKDYPAKTEIIAFLRSTVENNHSRGNGGPSEERRQAARALLEMLGSFSDTQ
jgi:hypothetical protein